MEWEWEWLWAWDGDLNAVVAVADIVASDVRGDDQDKEDVDVGRVITSRGLCQGLDEWRLSIEWRASGQLVLRIRHCRPCAHDKVYKLEVEELGVIVLDGRL